MKLKIWNVKLERLRQHGKRRNPALHVAYLLVVGKTSHDRRVHDPVQQHGEGVDGQVGIVEMPLHHAADLLIGQLHRFHGVLQWTDLLLCGTGSEGVIRYSRRFQYLLYTQYITIVSVIPTIERKYLRSVTRDVLWEDGAQKTLNFTHKSCEIGKQWIIFPPCPYVNLRLSDGDG